MSFFTTATRMWLTKSVKPFAFKNEYDNVLPFQDLEALGLYIHIPFCEQICSFCPYCKELYDESLCKAYISHLIQEIHTVGQTHSVKKEVTSLYFGGGTPALAVNYLEEILQTVEQYFIITEGIGLELHPRNVTIPTLTALKKIGITKISIGIQSFQDKFLTILNREKVDYTPLFQAIQTVPFETVSMDFIFALPDQTIDDLKSDIAFAFQNGANHIVIYPFIDFAFTKTKLKSMPKNEKRKLLDEITAYCESMGYQRESIWTFSSQKNANYSSMTRDNFLGFGCSATTLLKNQFKVNTFSVQEYMNRIQQKQLPTSLTIRFAKKQRMIYYLFWTAYSTKVDSEAFKHFFGEDLKRHYGFELNIAKLLGYITEKNGLYEMTTKGVFYYHYYENFYTLSYIDKMWGIMRSEAFPQKINL